MITTLSEIEILKSELKKDLDNISDLEGKNKKASERLELEGDEYLDLAALGYTIHNLYGLMENALYRIAKSFENNLNPSSWHKDLLNRMLLDVKNIRPRVISDKTYVILDDLRGFRHIFRNQYNRGLDNDKVLNLQNKIPQSIKLFRNDIEMFLKYLDALKKGISG